MSQAEGGALDLLLVALDFKPQPGGIAEYTHHVAEGLHERGHELLVLSLPADGDADYDAQAPFPVRRLDLPDTNPDGPSYQWALYKGIRDAIEAHDPDWILHNALDRATHACSWAAKRTGRPVCTFVHGSGVRTRTSSNPLDYDNPASWLIERSRLKSGAVRADRVVTVSSFTKRALEDVGVDPDRITLVPPLISGTDGWSPEEDRVNQLRERFDVDDGFLLLTVSRLVERKGVDKVLEALASRRDELPDLRYVVAGDGPDRERLEQRAEDLDLGDIVSFAGFVDADVKHHLYEAADLFVMPNRELDDGDVEGFGIVFLEANAHGTPVIGGRSGGAVDAIEHEGSGLLVDPEDPEAVGEAIARLAEDPDLLASMADRGRQRLEQKLDFDANLDELEAILQAQAAP